MLRMDIHQLGFILKFNYDHRQYFVHANILFFVSCWLKLLIFMFEPQFSMDIDVLARIKGLRLRACGIPRSKFFTLSAIKNLICSVGLLMCGCVSTFVDMLFCGNAWNLCHLSKLRYILHLNIMR